MPDFTSALYLGFRHESRVLRPWTAFTTGAPAALVQSALARTVARNIAELQGCERATLAASTLHVFWDLFGVLGTHDTAVLLDAGAYPIARWGAERPTRNTAPWCRCSSSRRRVAGGVARRCPARPAANRRGRRILPDLRPCRTGGRPAGGDAAVRRARGAGRHTGSRRARPLAGTAGTLGTTGRRHAAAHPDVRRRHRAGLLDGQGVRRAPGRPIRVARLVARFERHSETRMHCSPPTMATLHAAEHALTLNRSRGDALRLRLAQLAGRFHTGSAERGIAVDGGLFPVQSFGALSCNGIRAIAGSCDRASEPCSPNRATTRLPG